jgi:hypothetical protein
VIVMHIVIVYESMFGNTRQIAESIAGGTRRYQDAKCFPVGAVDAQQVATADLLVVGAPTHAWSLSRPATRRTAAEQAAASAGGLKIEPSASRTGIREWLATRPMLPRRVAVFDTRRNVPLVLSGHAGRAIGRTLRACGMELVRPPESFLVDAGNSLLPGEWERARDWGRALARHTEPVSLRGHVDDLI